MIQTSDRNRIITFWILLAACCLTILPFLGLADFNTKGEPREAVVALSILEQNDWILPTNNGGEIPYKPPFFHWCVAAASSLFNGGNVNEYTSRLPSALALIVTVMATFNFFSRRRDLLTGLLAAAVTFTTLEMQRAGTNTRVDMVLTMFTVLAIYSLYDWNCRRRRRFPWVAILYMSCATLTKGPVGIIVPCLAIGVFMLTRRVNFFKALGWMALMAAASLIIPLVWYYAAYLERGDAFLDLVLEENFGRMTNTMSYDSCVHPWPYNIGVLLSGLLPWTVACIFALFTIRIRRSNGESTPLPQRIKHFFSQKDSLAPFALITAATIFIFYCIPQSKRSVYLLPMYPFVAYWLARMLIAATRNSRKAMLCFYHLIAGIAMLLFVAFISFKIGLVPESLFSHGRHAAENLQIYHNLCDATGWRVWLCASVPPLAALAWWIWGCRMRSDLLPVGCAGVVMAVFLSVWGAYQPCVMNAKSVKPVAQLIEKELPADAPIYEYIHAAETALGDPLHYFEVNFYLGDRIRNFRKESPREGWLMISDEDFATHGSEFEAEGYRFDATLSSPRPVMRQATSIHHFTRTE